MKSPPGWVSVSDTRCMRSIFSAVGLMSVGFALLSAEIIPARAQNRNITRCLSIADVNERVECLEGQVHVPVPSPTNAPSDRQPQARVAPSFDCRAATNSIERAICSDDELAEWDSRMGLAFQQALRLRKDGQALLEGQRRWIIQRSRACGSTSEIPFSCLLDMTKQRVSALSEEIAGGRHDSIDRAFAAFPEYVCKTDFAAGRVYYFRKRRHCRPSQSRRACGSLALRIYHRQYVRKLEARRGTWRGCQRESRQGRGWQAA